MVHDTPSLQASILTLGWLLSSCCVPLIGCPTACRGCFLLVRWQCTPKMKHLHKGTILILAIKSWISPAVPDYLSQAAKREASCLSIFIDIFRFSGRNKNSLFVFPLMSLRANWKNTNAQTCINYIDFVLQKFSLWLARLYSVLSLSHATLFFVQLRWIIKVGLFFPPFYWVTFFISFHLPFFFILLAASVCWYWLPQLTWQHSWI